MDSFRAFVPILLILAAPVGMLYPLWSNPVSAGEDDVLYYYPVRKMVGQALREGRWPVATNADGSGVPLLADPQTAVLHPPTWLFAVLPARRAYCLSILLAFWAAGLGALAYLRRLKLTDGAATFGAFAFMFCGFMVAHRVHLGMIHTAAMLPWGLWAIEMLRERPRGALAGLVPIFALAVVAGHWPTLIHIGLVWTAYLLLRGRPLLRSVTIYAAAGALALAIAAPQLVASFELFSQATRSRIGYATAGENSFFPLAGVLAGFPFLMGSRTPNFFSQQWWGPWHLCEMLGYVGLVTLVLAGAAVWRLYRKRPAAADAPADPFTPVVRVWTWLGVAAGVWMLGTYLPTYRLIHMLPVLGNVRCPARMVLTVDLALAVLAAVAVHSITAGQGTERLAATIRRGAIRVLPLAMGGGLLAVVAFTWLSQLFLGAWPVGCFPGSPAEALQSFLPTNPAIWLPLGVLGATVAVVGFWLRAPQRRTAVLVLLLLGDLFVLTRFVDVPPGGTVTPDPDASLTAYWLKGYRGPDADANFRVWGLGRSYCDRPNELLLPMSCAAHGIETIAAYGPFQSPAHAHLFGFRPWGETREWANLLRRNRLLSLYGVRYVLAAEPEFRDVIESIRIPVEAPLDDGPNVLAGLWTTTRAEVDEDLLRLRAPSRWLRSQVSQPVSLEAGTIYRISLDVRGPDGGAADQVRADVFAQSEGIRYDADDARALVVEGEQVGEDWRHFEWTFRMTAEALQYDEVLFRVYTLGERPVEVRNVSLRPSHLPTPIDPDKRLAPGDVVYHKLVEVPALDPRQYPVAIYENRLCRRHSLAKAAAAEVESLKWSEDDPTGSVPDVTLRTDKAGVMAAAALAFWTLPTTAVYVVVLLGWGVVARVRSKSRRDG